jgi:hypothetical protein
MDGPLVVRSADIMPDDVCKKIPLLGQASFRDYLNYVRDRAVGGATANPVAE